MPLEITVGTSEDDVKTSRELNDFLRSKGVRDEGVTFDKVHLLLRELHMDVPDNLCSYTPEELLREYKKCVAEYVRQRNYFSRPYESFLHT